MDTKSDLKPEIDFRDLLKKPRKLFGYSYFYFLIVLMGLGISYVGNLTVIGKNAMPAVVLKDSTAFVADIPFQSPAALPPVDVVKVSVPSPEMIERGKDLFRANCSSCHGENGGGDGPAGAVMNPKPRNFRTLAGWTNGSKVSQIYKTLQEGIIKNGMASYSYMPPADRFAMIHYVRTFATGQPIDTPEELQALETTYQLSKGMSTPGQIPVKKALQTVISEHESSVRRIAQMAEETRTAMSEGAEVFSRVVRDRSRVLTAFTYARPEITDLDQFAKMVSADPVELGFSADVVQLSATEWSMLLQYIRETRRRGGV